MKKILIIGATSAIAQATARLYCNEKASFYLVGRDAEKLDIVRDDLLLRGASEVGTDTMNPVRLEDHEFMISRAELFLGQIDITLIAYGELPNQKECEKSARKTIKALTINSVSTLSLVTILAERLLDQGQGALVVISSVAGDRGRASNYIYGAAKSSVSVFMEGLASRLRESGVLAITIKPGFVDTPMTALFKKNLLWVQPEIIASGIKRAIEKKSAVVYLPWFWRWIMLVIKLMPDWILRRLPL